MTEVFRIGQVTSTAAGTAYRFHAAVSLSDEHIWPRSEDQMRQYTDEGSLFAIWRESTGEYVGLVYSILEEEHTPPQWEVGGLTVAAAYRDRGLGSLLVRFAVAHTFAFAQPWINSQHVVAHVHEENMEPRNVLHRLGFDFYQMVEIPGEIAPKSMKRNKELNVSGLELRFTVDGLRKLTDWFASDTLSTLRNGDTVVFDLGPVTLDDLRRSLEDTEHAPPH
jgi:RimJ/RimL family protein N-acetyltransferase